MQPFKLPMSQHYSSQIPHNHVSRKPPKLNVDSNFSKFSTSLFNVKPDKFLHKSYVLEGYNRNLSWTDYIVHDGTKVVGYCLSGIFYDHSRYYQIN